MRFWHLTSEGAVTLVVFDMLGREVATLVDEVQAAGIHSAGWNPSGPRGASSGVYVARLAVRGASGSMQYAASQKIILMK